MAFLDLEPDKVNTFIAENLQSDETFAKMSGENMNFLATFLREKSEFSVGETLKVILTPLIFICIFMCVCTVIFVSNHTTDVDKGFLNWKGCELSGVWTILTQTFYTKKSCEKT